MIGNNKFSKSHKRFSSNEKKIAQKMPLYKKLQDNEQWLQEMFNNCSDVVFRKFRIQGRFDALLIFVDGLVDNQRIDQMILKPLMYDSRTIIASHDLMSFIKDQIVSVGQAKSIDDMNEVVSSVLSGETAIILEGTETALVFDVKSWMMRSVEEPSSESVIRGPREGFNENIRTNTSILRRKIKSPKLKFEALKVGETSNTELVIAYLEGIAKDSLVLEVRQRLERIEIDSVLESGYIEEFIEDAPFSPFPTVHNTERPDVVAASLQEGKVAILLDNTPFALIVPITFWNGLIANEDYYERYWVGTVIRFIRFGALLVTLFLPAGYVALTTYHQEMIPTSLLLSIAASREPVPFPAIIEALIMEITFEGLREAGLRLPSQVGQAVSIVGALVIGQAAVQAGIVSAAMVIVVAITGIASFTIPNFSLGISLRIIRFPFIFLAGMLGLYGMTVGVMLILIHLCSLRSFDIPYLTPMASTKLSSWRDIFIRAPWWKMNYRPEQLTDEKARTRIPQGQKPGPEQGDS